MNPASSHTATSERVPLADDARTPADAPTIEGLGPIKTGERIAEIDILRGFALLGIGVINLQNFLGPNGVSGDQPLFPAWYDRAAEFLVNLFGSGKFNAMFSFLFGVGFAIQMGRASAKGAPFAAMYLRRLAALLLFGLAHAALLWDGDVLHIYAAIGIPLVLCRTLRDRWLWLIVALCVIVPIVRFGIAAYLGEKPSRTPLESYNRSVETLRVYGKGTYTVPAFVDPEVKKTKTGPAMPIAPPVEVVSRSTYPRVVIDRVGEWLHAYREGAAWFWPILGTTLVIGFIVGRRGIFQDIPRYLPKIRKWTIVCGVVGGLIAVGFASVALIAPPGEQNVSPLAVVAGIAYILGRPILCAFYMGLLILMARSDRFRGVLAPLALVGRMPLTNYLMQSLVFSTLFYGYAVGLFYRVGPAVSLPIAFGLYAIQVLYSNWWMKRFRFGPMEWLWRTLTYGKPPAMTTA